MKRYQEMFEKEKNLPPDQRIDFVSVVTPNHVHFGPSQMALESGFHVLVEKPIAFSVAEAKTLEKTVGKTGLASRLNAYLHRISLGKGSTQDGG